MNVDKAVFKTIHECNVMMVSYTTNDDSTPATAARVSYANDLKKHDESRDEKLIKYLSDNHHLTPFEYQFATMMVECPLFVRSQIMRHRTFSYNEISRRYTSDELGFWVPDHLRVQDNKNKQSSTNDFVHDENVWIAAHKTACKNAYNLYECLIGAGTAREQARAVLPQSLLTRFYMGGNLRNWSAFLKLRLDSHAQPETTAIAIKIRDHLASIWPKSLKALLQ